MQIKSSMAFDRKCYLVTICTSDNDYGVKKLASLWYIDNKVQLPSEAWHIEVTIDWNDDSLSCSQSPTIFHLHLQLERKQVMI